jgi:hypothetical protein
MTVSELPAALRKHFGGAFLGGALGWALHQAADELAAFLRLNIMDPSQDPVPQQDLQRIATQLRQLSVVKRLGPTKQQAWKSHELIALAAEIARLQAAIQLALAHGDLLLAATLMAVLVLAQQQYDELAVS